MANYSSILCTITGSREEINSIYNTMKEVENLNKLGKFSNYRFEDLMELLNYPKSSNWFIYRGGWDKVTKRGNVLKMAIGTDGRIPHEIFDLLKQRFSSIEYYYKSNNYENKCTNDLEGKFYKCSKAYYKNNWFDIQIDIYMSKILTCEIEKDKQRKEEYYAKVYELIDMRNKMGS